MIQELNATVKYYLIVRENVLLIFYTGNDHIQSLF